MPKSIDVTLDWADDTYTFRLGLEQLEEHDDILKAGPLAVLGSLVDGTWRLPAIRETLRLGLIGGGLKPTDAIKLVRRYVDNRPLVESLPYAIAVLGAAVNGDDKGEDDQPGKQAAAKPETDPEPEPGLTSPPSVGTPSSSASATVI